MKNVNEVIDVLGKKLVSIGEVTVTPGAVNHHGPNYHFVLRCVVVDSTCLAARSVRARTP